MQQNVSLKPYNTFGIDVDAEYFTVLESLDQLPALTALSLPRHVLGGGSNILLTGTVSGLVIQNQLKGITIAKEDNDHVWLRAASGEVWHELVLYAINAGLGGIENLALIPGTVGAAPIQNIGAYGVEVKDTIDTVDAWNWQEQKIQTFSNADCCFGYRDSIFKHSLKDKTLITAVVFKLNKRPVFNTTYGAIGQELESLGVQELSVKAIAHAVMNIRRSKLPDPKVIGNAGSFFKNPTLPSAQYDALLVHHPDMPHYAVSPGLVKVPAGWLIERCGWKGYKKGFIGVHAKQALVLVNYGNAKGSDIWKLSGEIVASVHERFGIELEREVGVW
jgi:UDP-N-acetylmuramate dehydrogenase